MSDDGSARSRPPARPRGCTTARASASRGARAVAHPPSAPLLRQLSAIERDGGEGALRFPDGTTLPVTHCDRVLFPADGITKGDLLRYYLRVADVALPPIAGRALVLTRFPQGIGGPGFHQHDPGEHPPDAVAVAELPTADDTPARRLVGSLPALLWAVQLGAVGVDAWHARVDRPDDPDYMVLDLDPGPDVPFADVVRLARLVRAELGGRSLGAVLKTSGSRGIHLLVPLAPGTGWDASAALAEEVAAAVVASAPDLATLERAIADRPAGTIYLDHMQNARGKTLAAAFTVRARPGATVSTPLAPTQLRATLDPRRFTTATVPRQLGAVAARWADAWQEAAPRRAWRP